MMWIAANEEKDPEGRHACLPGHQAIKSIPLHFFSREDPLVSPSTSNSVREECLPPPSKPIPRLAIDQTNSNKTWRSNPGRSTLANPDSSREAYQPASQHPKSCERITIFSR